MSLSRGTNSLRESPGNTMLRVALTGGIGSGKSTVSEVLRVLGVPVLDADAISHQLTAHGQPAVAEIAKIFGENMLANDGGQGAVELIP